MNECSAKECHTHTHTFTRGRGKKNDIKYEAQIKRHMTNLEIYIC